VRRRSFMQKEGLLRSPADALLGGPEAIPPHGRFQWCCHLACSGNRLNLQACGSGGPRRGGRGRPSFAGSRRPVRNRSGRPIAAGLGCAGAPGAAACRCPPAVRAVGQLGGKGPRFPSSDPSRRPRRDSHAAAGRQAAGGTIEEADMALVSVQAGRPKAAGRGALSDWDP